MIEVFIYVIVSGAILLIIGLFTSQKLSNSRYDVIDHFHHSTYSSGTVEHILLKAPLKVYEETGMAYGAYEMGIIKYKNIPKYVKRNIDILIKKDVLYDTIDAIIPVIEWWRPLHPNKTLYDFYYHYNDIVKSYLEYISTSQDPLLDKYLPKEKCKK